MIRLPIVPLLALSCSAALALAQDGQGTKGSLVEVAAKAGHFSTLVAAVKAAGLVDTLSGKGPFTVFAPTDEAFARLGKDAIADLLKPENKHKLVAVLTYHVVGANLPAAKVAGQKTLTTVQGQPLPVVVDGGKVKVGGANVTAVDVAADNGVIHVVDAVLMPPAEPNLVEVATKAGTFTTLLAAAKAAGLVDTLATGGPFTVFAPSDDAFARLGKDTIADLLKPENKEKLASILKHHVVAGKVMAADAMKRKQAKTIADTTLTLQSDGTSLTVGGAKVVTPDVAAKNGVIHVVDAVILPAN